MKYYGIINTERNSFSRITPVRPTDPTIAYIELTEELGNTFIHTPHVFDHEYVIFQANPGEYRIVKKVKTKWNHNVTFLKVDKKVEDAQLQMKITGNKITFRLDPDVKDYAMSIMDTFLDKHSSQLMVFVTEYEEPNKLIHTYVLDAQKLVKDESLEDDFNFDKSNFSILTRKFFDSYSLEIDNG